MYKCRFCDKEVGNRGCLVIHETACHLNPNRRKCENRTGNGGRKNGNHCKWKGKTKNDCEQLRTSGKKLSDRYKNGELVAHQKGKPRTEEEKRKISESLKKYLNEHPERRWWKGNISEPCERLKEFLRSKGIDFVEEYEAFDDRKYSIDIAFPDEKIGIEVNGNQHYNSDGSLSEYYQKRHDLFTDRGWIIYEIYYSKCYNPEIEDFSDILSLPIYDKNYIEYKLKMSNDRKIRKIQIEEERNRKILDRIEKKKERKEIIRKMLYESGIDFSRSGWNKRCREYLLGRGELFNKKIFETIRKYYPEFLKDENVWKRKGSIY